MVTFITANQFERFREARTEGVELVERKGSNYIAVHVEFEGKSVACATHEFYEQSVYFVEVDEGWEWILDVFRRLK